MAGLSCFTLRWQSRHLAVSGIPARTAFFAVVWQSAHAAPAAACCLWLKGIGCAGGSSAERSTPVSHRQSKTHTYRIVRITKPFSPGRNFFHRTCLHCASSYAAPRAFAFSFAKPNLANNLSKISGPIQPPNTESTNALNGFCTTVPGSPASERKRQAQ